MSKIGKKENFLRALESGYGIILTACEAVGISRTTYYKWMKEDADFREKVSDINEGQIDFVESKLIKAISANDTTAIIFYLKTKGKSRGYTQKAAPKEEKSLRVLQVQTAPAKDESKLIANKVRKKKAYIVKLLKEQKKYTAELTCQVDITAKLLVRADILGEEIFANGYHAVNVEYSREGNERVTLNPKERLYIELLEKGQKALRALGMNTESKDRKSDNDTFSDFMEAMQEKEE